jgi:hypothetical protein
LIAEIPVGIEPVSVHPRSNNEVWIVNEVSDSVSQFLSTVAQGTVWSGNGSAEFRLAETR